MLFSGIFLGCQKVVTVIAGRTLGCSMDEQETLSTDAMRRVAQTGDPTDPMVIFITAVLRDYDLLDSSSGSSTREASLSSGCSASTSRNSRNASVMSD